MGYRIARNFCGPKILQIAVKRPSADNSICEIFLRIKLSTVKLDGLIKQGGRVVVEHLSTAITLVPLIQCLLRKTERYLSNDVF